LSGADLVIYDAPDVKDKCEILGGQGLNTAFLHFGVDTNFFTTRPYSVRQAWRERYHIPQDAVVLLSPRAWNSMYRHHDILEAFSMSLGKLTRKAYLVFKLYNGNNDSEIAHSLYKQNMISRAEALGISDVVLFVDEMTYDELPELYAMSDIVVNFPEMDALGITLMEAAACYRQIISIELHCYKGTFVEKYAKMVTNITGLEKAIIGAVNELPSAKLLIQARKEVETFFDCHFFCEKLDAINKTYGKNIETGK